MPIRTKACAEPPRGCGRPKLIDEFWHDSKEPDGHQRFCIECVKRGRRERAMRRAEGDDLPAITEDRRREMAENAKRLHAEGRLGGSTFGRLGGRPRKPRIGEAVIDHFRGNSMLELVIQAYESNLRSRNRGQRLRAAEALNNLEQMEDKRLREARGSGKDPSDMQPEELQAFLEQGIAALIEEGEIDMTALTLPESAIREVA